MKNPNNLNYNNDSNKVSWGSIGNMDENVEKNSGIDNETIDILKIALKDHKEGKYYGRGSGNLVLDDEYWQRVEDAIKKFDDEENFN